MAGQGSNDFSTGGSRIFTSALSHRRLGENQFDSHNVTLFQQLAVKQQWTELWEKPVYS